MSSTMEVYDKHWKYINEGNVHIVLRILNTDYVLRLIKEEENKINVQSVEEGIMFVNLVTAPLICANSQYQEALVELTSGTLEHLSNNLHEIRPNFRRNKSVFSKFAIKAPNLTMISQNTINYCIEIKPKEGFKCNSFGKIPKCYYCLKQLLKLYEGQIKTVSNYCPLSLFSGDRKKMKTALLSLLYNPQNNLKIFKNGEIVYNEKSIFNEFDELIKSMNLFKQNNLFFDFIITILLSKGNSNTILHESEPVSLDLKPEECIEHDHLETGMFLHKLLCLQKLSENVSLPTNVIDSGFNYVSDIFKTLELHNLHLYNDYDVQKFLENTDPLHLSLISAVAKDCSIMISFASESINGLPNIQVGDKKISYRISATDLEPKSVKSLIKRKSTEMKLINVYHAYVDSSENLSSVKESDTELKDCSHILCVRCATMSHLEKFNLVHNFQEEESQHSLSSSFPAVIQPHSETRLKQLEAWQQLIAEYMKVTKQSTIDIRESQNSPLFNNNSINRKLSQESVLTILEDMTKNGRAAPIDKSKNVWEIYWHSLDEWGNMIYSWACSNGMNNSVCTLFELTGGENTEGEEFHGLDVNILIKALKSLELKGKCELMQFDDNQGVKFF